MPYSVIDLFAGAGGLSLGFQQTNNYIIKAAYESNPTMQETYRNNHPGVDVYDDVCDADYAELQRKYGPIDVVIGGPPCQGFSNANRQRNHAVSMNNMLIKQYIHAILELQPKAFVMENVSMLRSEIHRFYRSEQDAALVDEYQIPGRDSILVLLDRQYCFDEALSIIQNADEINAFLWPEDDYSELNIIYKASKNPDKLLKALDHHKKKFQKLFQTYIADECNHHIRQKNFEAFSALQEYYEGKRPAEEIKYKIENAIMIQRMLSKAKEILENHLVVDEYLDNDEGIAARICSYSVSDYLKKILQSDKNKYRIESGVICAADYGAPQKRMRFVVIGIKKAITESPSLPKGTFDEGHYRTVRDAIEDLEEIEPYVNVEDDEGIELYDAEEISELGALLRDSGGLKNHIITDTTDTAMERFMALDQGENFHALSEEMRNNTYTDSARTQNTIYLRLKYDEPSGTVVNVRKSMWIHPTLDRAVSIREAARLQTFPDSFFFYGTKDRQYQQVGNAVPPIMAKAIADHLTTLLDGGDIGEAKMADNHTKEVRSMNMSHIRSTNSKPEEKVRKYLFSRKLRFRKNVKDLPGRPDIVLKKYKTAIFVNGCFWHKHDCPRFVWPTTNVDYWTKKINGNVERDEQNVKKLAELGWKVITVWECELKKGKAEDRLDRLYNEITIST